MRNPQTSLLRLLKSVVNREVDPVSEKPIPHDSRRLFIKQLSVAAAGTALSGQFFTCRSAQKPTIATVGAGLAGLSAAYYLEKAGLQTELFEAANRVGGRVMSAKNLLADGIVTEMGGEFIDSHHREILTFCRAFDLPLLDTKAPAEQSLNRINYVFDGRHIGEREIVQAFAPFAGRIRQDVSSLGRTFAATNPAVEKLDRLSVDEYLHQLGLSGWLFTLISTSFTSEYGLPAGDQSCLNMLILLNPDTAKGFELYGESDERYKVIGGNERIAAELHKRLKSPIHTGFHLERIAQKGTRYQLSFANGRTINADYVVMTLPFSVLRAVTFDVAMSARKRRCIQELGYGTTSKLFIGVDERIWRRGGCSGVAFSESIQNGWDSSHMQHSNTGPGGYTLLLGGEPGRTLTLTQFDTYLTGCDQVFAGIRQAANGRRNLFNWSRNALSGGAYSCYKVGQMTALGQAEGERVGNILFAGEHCSSQFQGFMNGAAETGRKAADDIVLALRASPLLSRPHTRQPA